MRINKPINKAGKQYPNVAVSLVISNTVIPEARDTEGNLLRTMEAGTNGVLNMKPYTNQFEVLVGGDISYSFNQGTSDKIVKQLLNDVNDLVAKFILAKKL